METMFMGTAMSEFQQHPTPSWGDGLDTARSDWESEVAHKLEGRPSHIKGNLAQNDLPRFLERREDYILRAASLGMNMFRTSIEWGRFSPRPGEFNDAYMMDVLKTLGHLKRIGEFSMEPMITLQHFTLPAHQTVFDHHGEITASAWETPGILGEFRRYVTSVARFLTDPDKIRTLLDDPSVRLTDVERWIEEGLVKYIMTINEPSTLAFNGYVFGFFPPYQKGKIFRAKKILRTMAEAHRIAWEILKAQLPYAHVGVGHAMGYFTGPFGAIAHRYSNEGIADMFEWDGALSDFIGIQYYTRYAPFWFQRFKRDATDHPFLPDAFPAGITHLLNKMHHSYPRKPIFISEFGFADKKDVRKPMWILETVQQIINARGRGIPVLGMLLWSLVDNFEWNLGMACRFGLFREKELGGPFKTDSTAITKGRITSADAWKAAVNYVLKPSDKTQYAFETLRGGAFEQYERAKKKKKIE